MKTTKELAEHIIWAAHANDTEEERLAVANLAQDPKWLCKELGRVSDFCERLKDMLEEEMSEKCPCGSCRYFENEDSLGQGFCSLKDILTTCSLGCREGKRK